jgi:hypothetical protein
VPPLITLEQLKKKLKWDNIIEFRHEEQRAGGEFIQGFELRPTNPHFEPIVFLFDGAGTSLECIGFSNWHCHPYLVWSSRNSEVKFLIEAIRLARDLIQKEQCLIEQVVADGRYLCSGPKPAGQLPNTLNRRTARLHRIFFDRKPIIEEIDFSRYYKGKHGYISHEHKAELERTYTEMRIEFLEW